MDRIEVTFDGYIDTLSRLRYSLFSGSDAAWNIFLDMVENELLDLSAGPANVLEDFANNADIVERGRYEWEYPEYAKIMTWEEFIENECRIGNEDVAVLMD